MDKVLFDRDGRFLIEHFSNTRPFASFLPGIAGPSGVPMWVFYVNRGQAIASFGIENKDHPIMEFDPANRAYQTTPYTGFRTFLKLKQGTDTVFYEPFAPWSTGDATRMHIGMNDLELQTTSTAHDLETRVLYFTLPGEAFCGLVRQVSITHLGKEPLALEILDGMARVIPFGLDNRSLKEMGRTMEAWMAVFALETGVPFYRLQASTVDSTKVSEIIAGHFYLAFDDAGNLLRPFVDPVVIFGQNTGLSAPDRFLENSLETLSREQQITTGRTPCGIFGASATLTPGETLTLYAIIGHAGDIAHVHHERDRLAQPAYVQQKHHEARKLIEQLTGVIDTHTSSPLFDAYTRQSFLDNVLRGGWPLFLGDAKTPAVYHVYSRKHGDLERDYNYFVVAAEPYSQGNANYRDVIQNRRSDVLFTPGVGAFNILTFLDLIQADGYNPLVVQGSRFTLSPEYQTAALARIANAEMQPWMAPLLAQPFTPGRLLRTIHDQKIQLKVSPERFVAEILTHAKQHIQATFSEGYWIDHWTYILDLIESYLSIYPDQKRTLLFSPETATFFDSPAIVQPRTRRYVLAGEERVRQYHAVAEDEEKAALIARRRHSPNLMRVKHGEGSVYRTSVFGKLVGLALLKFATLDPLGMGIEMEAGRPGWYDALNGLPALIGSSLCETYELARLLTFLIEAMTEKATGTATLPLEQYTLLHRVRRALDTWSASEHPDRDFRYWDAVNEARETYREQIRLGFDGEMRTASFTELVSLLEAFQAKVHLGLRRAVEMNDGIPPTYFAYTAVKYRVGDETDAQGRPYVTVEAFEPQILPLFLEGPVHALKVAASRGANATSDPAAEIHARVKTSPLFDHDLGMYKVNTSLEALTHEIGRARAFTPGWLENESIWLHMEYKYLLEVLKAGLWEAFYDDFKRTLIPFQNLERYGRSLLENSSFLVSSAHPDASLHGAGFVARLSGATAEFLSIWAVMMAGQQPFQLKDGRLQLALQPALPGWLFRDDGALTFTFLGQCSITYHNPARKDTFDPEVQIVRLQLELDGQEITLESDVIDAPYAEMVRAGRIKRIQAFFG
ncbi:MAG: cellobiose phosphorylase [Anaerolineae bacterium]|nr:cellobiose phosphorylase [Anaerolineae bacterium]